MSHFEVTPTMFQVRLYDQHKDNYVGSFYITINGNNGFITSAYGSGFYGVMPNLFNSICDFFKINSIECTVMESHERLLLKAMNSFIIERINSYSSYERNVVHLKIIKNKDN
jgi:hypothetical protein